jgi:hypothetical protein
MVLKKWSNKKFKWQGQGKRAPACSKTFFFAALFKRAFYFGLRFSR